MKRVAVLKTTMGGKSPSLKIGLGILDYIQGQESSGLSWNFQPICISYSGLLREAVNLYCRTDPPVSDQTPRI